MKFVQSFWSKPFFDDTFKNNWNFRHHGGFPNPFLFYCAWTYSCLSIKKYYPDLHLITDDKGLEIFKDALKLPYASFSDSLNDLEDYHKGAWALGKLYTYRLQKEPFCHLDGDVFLFGKVLDPVLKSPLFCQSYDHDQYQYSEIHPYIHQHFENVPTAFEAELSDTIKYVNVGIIGGSAIDFFQEYTSKAFELIDENQDKLDDINTGLFNLYYEQFLLSNMLSVRKLAFASLYPKPNDGNAYNFAAFHHIPHKSQYIHLISHLKKTSEYLEQIVARLRLEFPDYYVRLRDYCQKKAL